MTPRFKVVEVVGVAIDQAHLPNNSGTKAMGRAYSVLDTADCYREVGRFAHGTCSHCLQEGRKAHALCDHLNATVGSA